jgi:hypothetical protein
VDQDQTRIMKLPRDIFPEHTDPHRTTALTGESEWFAPGRRTPILQEKSSRRFQLTHTASLHTLAPSFRSQTARTSSNHPAPRDQGT